MYQQISSTLQTDSRKTADEASTVTNLPRETLASSTHAYGPQYPDVFCENRSVSTLTEAEKISLLICKWDSEDLCKYKFPLRNISGYNRRLNPKVMKQASWLRYSPSADSVYCGYCYLFGVQAFRTSDWSNISKFVDRHVGENASHHTAVARGQAFIDVHRGAPDIRQQLQNQRVQAIEENRAILKSITEVVVTMTRQNISLRGHVPEESNFNSLMALVAQHNSTLRHHLENARGNAKYTSPEIQNELLDLSAQQIVNNIVSDCKKAGCYAFIADESTDVSVKEQISVCVRFVQKGNNGRHIIREEFLSFVDADKGTNAEALTTKFLEALNNLGLPLDQMRAQGYDGASVMSGHINGVQARIQRQNPKAAYIHCRAHVLNLCIVHSSKLPLIRNIMDTMQEVSLAFKFSAKRFLVFQEQLRQNADVREEMGRQSKLKVLCETRWASRADCLNVFVTSFQVIVDTLNELSESGDNKARGLHSSILKWDFIVTAVILQHIFECTHRLSVYLQC
ncbi:zinc finger MYM-type protein 1-like [Montipora foliosa]|uniref:zinc finger MYM-type protein 1-like n=1 Tax=Montipora foliosa TaxID=591990 RepID=UPI0035F1DEA1